MLKEYRLVVQPSGRVYPARPGQTIMEATGHEAGLAADCGGKGQCGKCVVQVSPVGNVVPAGPEERKYLADAEINQGYRLACLVRIAGDINVILSAGDNETQVISGKTLPPEGYQIDPSVCRLYLPAWPEPGPEGRPPRDLVERALVGAEKSYHRQLIFPEREALAALSRPDSASGNVTIVNHLIKGVTAVIPGRRLDSLGFAFDIGTTTLAAYLCDLTKGEILATSASANPQRRFGADVISRITFVNKRKDGLCLLKELLVAELNRLMDRCLNQAGAQRGDIDEVVVVGNTTMEHIFCGFNPYSLGLAPYLPVQTAPQDLRAADLGLNLSRDTNVHVFPVISGFVGGDTVGAILAAGIDEGEKNNLLIDIGTNGELVLGNRQALWATSCATGPALEGAHISSGMGAQKGAIDQVAIDPADYRVSYRTIGGAGITPRGICGSGMIDAVAEMLRAGILRPTGRITEDLPGVLTDAGGIGRAFTLAKLGETGKEKEISLTLSDIRQVQLAKAALAAGIKLLLDKTKITHLERIILTGAFGARFNWQNAVAIGMLPKPSGNTEIKVVDNAAGLGAVQALLDRNKREKAMRLSKRVNFLELANEANFVQEYTQALNFPLKCQD